MSAFECGLRYLSRGGRAFRRPAAAGQMLPGGRWTRRLLVSSGLSPFPNRNASFVPAFQVLNVYYLIILNIDYVTTSEPVLGLHGSVVNFLEGVGVAIPEGNDTFGPSPRKANLHSRKREIPFYVCMEYELDIPCERNRYL